MRIYITNAFSLSMLDREHQGGSLAEVTRKGFVRIPRPVDDPSEWLEARSEACYEIDEVCSIISAIGHPDTAAVLSGILGLYLEPNRVNVKLEPGVYVLVGQYIGPRLPEGATTLPDGARIEWWSV